MSEKLPNMLETTIQKIRDMVDANTVVGQPITTSDGDYHPAGIQNQHRPGGRRLRLRQL